MKLSIITVNLNNLDGLKRTIDSVVAQTFTDYEWIVIDGGSTDGSKELIEQYADRFAYWCSEPDKGIYYAMNKGIAHASGEWLQFLNSGDWLYENDTLKKCFNTQHYGDILYGNVVHVTSKGEKIVKFPQNIDFYFFINNFINHQASFSKRELFQAHKFDESLKIYADWALCLDFLFEGKTFEHINQFISYYDFNGMSSNVTQMHIDEHNKILFSFAEKNIPSYILDVKKVKDDLVLRNKYLEIDKLTKSHKSCKYIMNCTTKTIILLSGLLNKIEKIRSK
ncbi:MAG: glycosyltransferase [Bacteroidales bacterium]|nr:glycosyltransferase [Bacteroidales bacterium]